MRFFLPLFAFSFACIFSAYAVPGQVPGYGVPEKLLIIHADDIGMSHSMNRAAFEAMKKGMVLSGSVMVPCAWLPEALKIAAADPSLDLGVHLVLNSEWDSYRWKPVSAASLVPGLIDSAGYLWPESADVAHHASSEEVEHEMRTQIERAIAAGLIPSHLDTHMGTVFSSAGNFRAYLKLGREFHLPVMVPRWSAETEAYLRALGFPVTELKPVALEAEDQGTLMLDRVILGVSGSTLEERRQAYTSVLKSLQPGVTQLIIHPGIADEELRGITAKATSRDADFRIFTDPDTRALLQTLGIRPYSWREFSGSAAKAAFRKARD